MIFLSFFHQFLPVMCVCLSYQTEDVLITALRENKTYVKCERLLYDASLCDDTSLCFGLNVGHSAC